LAYRGDIILPAKNPYLSLGSEDRIPLLIFGNPPELKEEKYVLQDPVNLGAWPLTRADDVPCPL
jgi:hypothetical protein